LEYELLILGHDRLLAAVNDNVDVDESAIRATIDASGERRVRFSLQSSGLVEADTQSPAPTFVSTS